MQFTCTQELLTKADPIAFLQKYVLQICSKFTGGISARKKIFKAGRARIGRKILLHQNMFMIRSTINILSLVLNCFLFHNMLKKCLCQTISTYRYTTNQGIQIYYKWFH